MTAFTTKIEQPMVFMPTWPPVKSKISRIDLGPMMSLMQALGNPHLKLPPAIHIAGTNGKGSSVAYFKAILEDAGYKVHAYTSPHLLRFNERIYLAGDLISDDYLLTTLDHIRHIVEEHELDNSFFEITTAAAFIAFSETPADILLLETGLGGRLDATNIIPTPIMTLITPISYDHMESLGYDLQTIAAEKAGIIKQKVPCVVSAQTPEVFEVLLSKCEEFNAPSIVFGYDYMVTKNAVDFTLECKIGEDELINDFPYPRLEGDHQILNAGSVVAAILNDCLKGFDISLANIKNGINKVDWPARLQRKKVLGRDIIIDGAHNIGGAQVLAVWIKSNLSGPIALVLGMTKNRDVGAFAGYFKDIVDVIYCVRVVSEPSSYTAEKLAELVLRTGIRAVACDSSEDAILKASDAKSVVVAGSLFLAADVIGMRSQDPILANAGIQSIKPKVL